jgi:hypothetical protein
LRRILNNEKYATVKIDKDLSSEFKINKSLRQGDSIVLLLFNVVQLEDLKLQHSVIYLTNVDKFWQILMMWLLWDEDYRMLKVSYITGQTNK